MVKTRGGDRLEAELERIEREMKQATVRVGFLENATYPDGTQVSEVAAANEYGHRIGAAPEAGAKDDRLSVPPRPFFRNMIAKKKSGWPKALARLLRTSGYNTEYALLQAGEGIAGQLRQSISELKSPPLKQSTIDRKGFSKPLIDTGHMLNSVDYEVKT